MRPLQAECDTYTGVFSWQVSLFDYGIEFFDTYGPKAAL